MNTKCWIKCNWSLVIRGRNETVWIGWKRHSNPGIYLYYSKFYRRDCTYKFTSSSNRLFIISFGLEYMDYCPWQSDPSRSRWGTGNFVGLYIRSKTRAIIITSVPALLYVFFQVRGVFARDWSEHLLMLSASMKDLLPTLQPASLVLYPLEHNLMKTHAKHISFIWYFWFIAI